VDPAIVSVVKRGAPVPPARQAAASAPQEAPATPIKAVTASNAALPKNTSPFVGLAKEKNIRKPSAATLEKPFSALNIADAEEPESEDANEQEPPSIRRISINQTRTGKPMENVQADKADETFRRTRRGGRARKKEVAAQERRNIAGVDKSSVSATRKG
jgi:enhancer of mRNA-decapping protein 3